MRNGYLISRSSEQKIDAGLQLVTRRDGYLFMCWSFEEVTLVAGKGRSHAASGIAKTPGKSDDVRCRVTVLGKVGSWE